MSAILVLYVSLFSHLATLPRSLDIHIGTAQTCLYVPHCPLLCVCLSLCIYTDLLHLDPSRTRTRMVKYQSQILSMQR